MIDCGKDSIGLSLCLKCLNEELKALKNKELEIENTLEKIRKRILLLIPYSVEGACGGGKASASGEA